MNYFNITSNTEVLSILKHNNGKKITVALCMLFIKNPHPSISPLHICILNGLVGKYHIGILVITKKIIVN